MNWSDVGDALFGGVSQYGAILELVQNSVYAGAVLGLVGGLIGVFVMQRDMAFAVHGISELSFAGASAGLAKILIFIVLVGLLAMLLLGVLAFNIA